MPGSPTDPFDKVRAAAPGLPDVTEGTAWRVPALKVRGRMFACMASHRSAEPGTLVVRLDYVDRDWLIASDPRVYYLQPHYLNHPCALVRLRHITRAKLRELLRISRDYAAPRRATHARGRR